MNVASPTMPRRRCLAEKEINNKLSGYGMLHYRQVLNQEQTKRMMPCRRSLVKKEINNKLSGSVGPYTCVADVFIDYTVMYELNVACSPSC